MEEHSIQYGGEMGANQVYFILERAGFNVRGNSGEKLLMGYGAREAKIAESGPERQERAVLMMSTTDVKKLIDDLRTGKLRIPKDSDLAQRTQ